MERFSIIIPDIGVLRIAGLAGQFIVPELIDVAGFPFPGYLFENRTGKNF